MIRANEAKRNLGTNVQRLIAAVVVVASCVLVANVEAQTVARAPVKQEFKHVGPETAIGGMTSEERSAQQFILNTELLGKIPAKASGNPARVELTAADRAILAAPRERAKPLQIGVAKKLDPKVTVRAGQFERGAFEKAADGSFVWAMTFISPEAQAIRVRFEDVSLPAGVEMYFLSLQGEADGPYVDEGRNGDGAFWTRSISSDNALVLLRYSGPDPDAAQAQISFSVTDLAHVHARPRPAGLQGTVATHDTWPCGTNPSCLVDANCSTGTPADSAKRAIAKIEWIVGTSIFTCSGGLLADTDPSTQTPFFLTANHCLASSIPNLETWFNYTTSSCNGTCPHNILTGGAPPSDTIGISVLASSPNSDFTLGTLNQPPPAGSTFLGWNNSPIAFTNGARLHRISNPNFGPQAYTQTAVDTASALCTGLARGDFVYSSNISGETIGGSSGSPVVNAAGEVVGQLFGCCGFGCVDCVFTNNWTVDGAFAATWPSVKDLLDPQPDDLVAEAGGTSRQRFPSLVVPFGPSRGGSARVVPVLTAIRVKLVSLHTPAGPPNAPDFSAFNGEFRYLNAFRDPTTNAIITDCPDSGSLGTSYKCASVGCTPEYLDWATLYGGEPVHITGGSIVPSSHYEAVNLAASCAGTEPTCTSASAPLSVFTTRWGDANGDGAVTVTDVTSVVDRVKDLTGALTEPQVLVRAKVLLPVDWQPNVLEITNHVDALKNNPYPFTFGTCP